MVQLAQYCFTVGSFREGRVQVYMDEYSMMPHCHGNAKIGAQWRLQGTIAGDHFSYKA